MSTPGINDKLLWALTEKAQGAVALMQARGMDRDLAVAVLEQIWPEGEIYELPSDDERCDD